MPPKRSFADSDNFDTSSQPRTAKRLRSKTKETEQEVKTLQQQPKPLPLKHLDTSSYSSLAPKGYRPKSVGSHVTQWVESASGSKPHQEKHCQLDTPIGHLSGDIIPGINSYRSGTEENSQASRHSPSDAPSDMSLVQAPEYRSLNLAENNIYLRNFDEEFPEDIARLVNHIHMDRDSPGLSSDQFRQNTRLYNLENGTAELAVENYFKANIFPEPGTSDTLNRIDRNSIAKQVVPNVGSNFKVSTPVPDMLYGYNRFGAFPRQQAQLRSMGNDMIANNQDLLYPFFVIEFKADGPGGSGSMWVATNQCLGGSASCVNIAERLNCQLRQCKNMKAQPINSAVFSIAMNGTEARLYVSWKHDEFEYYMRKVDSFLLQRPDHYIEFRKHVLNIIDWGQDERLKEIKKSLDSLREENRTTAPRSTLQKA